MSASPFKISTILPTAQREPVSRQVLVTPVVTLIALLNAIGLLIALLRFAGALSDDLPRGAVLLAAVAATATVAVTRIAWRRLFPLEEAPSLDIHSSPHNWDAIIGWGSSLALLLLAVGFCYPGNLTSDWLIWFPALVADQFWRQTFFDAGHPALSPGIATADFDDDFDDDFDEALDQRLAATLAFPANYEQEEYESSEQIVQQLYRVRDGRGQEIVYGTVRADFEVGQRTAIVHVGFCPPLSHLPEIEAESLPGTSARIKIVQALAHGTRLEVRLPAPAETDCHVMIDMAATPARLQEKIGA